MPFAISYRRYLNFYAPFSLFDGACLCHCSQKGMRSVSLEWPARGCGLSLKSLADKGGSRSNSGIMNGVGMSEVDCAYPAGKKMD